MADIYTYPASIFDGFRQIEIIHRAIRVVAEPGITDIQVSYRLVEFGTFLIDRDGVTHPLTVQALPRTGTFSDVPAGQLPPEAIGGLTISEDGVGTLTTIYGLNVTFAQLRQLDTPEKLLAHLTAGPTSLFASDADDRFDGRGGNDNLWGGRGDDTLLGSSGNDALNGDDGRDRLLGGDGGDGLFGGNQGDSLSGDAGADLLHGGDGADTLVGGAGNDSFAGGFEADLLTGGAGADTFLYRNLPALNPRESGVGARDRITDFRPGIDHLDVSFIRAEEFDFLGRGPLTGGGQVRYRYEGRDTIVDVSTDDDAGVELSIRLTGRLTLTEGDFIL